MTDRFSGRTRNKVRELRIIAFHEQDGCCFWCERTMQLPLPFELVRDRSIATAEHIIPYTDGGPHTRANIAAACLKCNTRRVSRRTHEPSQITLEHARQIVAVRQALFDAGQPLGCYVTLGLQELAFELL